MEVNSNPTGETSDVLTSTQSSQEGVNMSGMQSDTAGPWQNTNTTNTTTTNNTDTTVADNTDETIADETAMFNTTLDNIIASGPSTVNDYSVNDDDSKKKKDDKDSSITAEEVRTSLENQAKNNNEEMYAKGKGDVPETFSSRFYEEENQFEGASDSTNKAFERSTAAIHIGPGSGNRAYDRITANGGTMKSVIDYLETLPDDVDVKTKELDKLGREYYDAAAGDIRAGLEIFSKTGDIIGKGTANRIGDAMTALYSGDIETAAKLIDENQVGIFENLKSGLWTNNPANKTIATLIGGAIISAAGGAVISKAAEKVVPKVVDKLINTAFNGEGASQKIAEKIVTSLAKNKNIAKELDMAQKFDDYKDLFESSKYLDELKKTQNIDDAISTIFGKPLDAASAAKRKEEIALFEEMTQTAADTLRNYKNFMGSAEDLGAENLVNLAKELENTFRPAFSNVLQNAVAAGKKDAVIAVLTDAISDNLKKAGDIAKPTAIAAGLATAIVENVEARPILPKQAETIAEQAPTGVVEKFDEKNTKLEDVDAGDAKDVVSDYMSNIEAKKENNEMAFAESKKSAGDIVRNAYSSTNTEMPDYVKQIADKMDEIHNSELTEIEKEAAYKNLYGEYDISQILKDLGIPVVSSTLKAIDAWKNGDWNIENKRSGKEFAEVTQKLKEAWNEGGFFNRIKSTIDAAKGYKAALQNTKMYTALKATQKAVGELLISALGIPAASIAPFMLILGKNIISNALKSASNGETSLDDISSEDFYNSFESTGEDETEAPEFSKKWDENAVPEDVKGYNAGLEEEEKARKELPSDAFVKIIYRKEPWIRKFRI